MNEEEVYAFIKEIVEGLRFLILKYNMHHRDIKLNNILKFKNG